MAKDYPYLRMAGHLSSKVTGERFASIETYLRRSPLILAGVNLTTPLSTKVSIQTDEIDLDDKRHHCRGRRYV